MRLNRQAVIGAAIMMAVSLGCSGGDRSGSGDAGGAGAEAGTVITDQDIRDYRLGDEALSRWQELQLKSASDPGLRVDPSADRTAPDGVNGAAATHMARTFENTPAVATTIHEGGLTPREFVLISFALYHAMAAQNAPTIPPQLLTTSENVEYVAANLPRINRYYAEQVEARQRAVGPEQPTP